MPPSLSLWGLSRSALSFPTDDHTASGEMVFHPSFLPPSFLSPSPPPPFTFTVHHLLKRHFGRNSTRPLQGRLFYVLFSSLSSRSPLTSLHGRGRLLFIPLLVLLLLDPPPPTRLRRRSSSWHTNISSQSSFNRSRVSDVRARSRPRIRSRCNSALSGKGGSELWSAYSRQTTAPQMGHDEREGTTAREGRRIIADRPTQPSSSSSIDLR